MPVSIPSECPQCGSKRRREETDKSTVVFLSSYIVVLFICWITGHGKEFMASVLLLPAVGSNIRWSHMVCLDCGHKY